MRTVGLLLVSALMIVPVATSQLLARSFRTTLAGAMAVGGVAAVGGLLIAASFPADTTVAPGPTIVLLALAMFAATWPVGAWLRRRRRLAEPFPILTDDSPDEHEVGHADGEHPHQHGVDCGH